MTPKDYEQTQQPGGQREGGGKPRQRDDEKNRNTGSDRDRDRESQQSPRRNEPQR